MQTRDLRTVRQNKGLTQKELAEKSGVGEITISLLENRKTTAQNETRRKLERVLGQRINWLATRGLGAYRSGEMTSWELVEQNFRKALFNIKSLQKKERAEFLKLAKLYLKEFEKEI